MNQNYQCLGMLFGLLLPLFLNAQSDSSEPETYKRPNIVIHTFDKKKYRARLETIGYDFLLVNAAPYESPAYLNEYYMRRDGHLYKVDAEYIQSIGMRKGRVVRNAALGGGITLAIIVAPVMYNTVEEESDDFLKASWAGIVGGGIGFVVGGFTGAVVGLFSRKTIKINGNPSNFGDLETYFFNK